MEECGINGYLKETVGVEVTKAVMEVLEKRPVDPIEFIALYLYKSADRMIYYYEQSLFNQELERMRQQMAEEKRLRALRMQKLRLQLEDMEVATGLKRPEDRVYRRGLWQSASELERALGDFDYDEMEKVKRLMALGLDPGAGPLSDLLRDHAKAGIGRAERGLLERREERELEDGRKRRPGDRPLIELEGKRLDELKGKRFDELKGKQLDELKGSDKSEDKDSAWKKVTAARYATSPSHSSARSRTHSTYTPSAASTSPALLEIPEDPEDANLDPISKALKKAMQSKLYYGEGVEIEPRIATWSYMHPPGRLVCHHPVLKNLTARSIHIPVDDVKQWAFRGYKCMSLYDHEIYVICDAMDDAVLWTEEVKDNSLLDDIFQSHKKIAK